MVTRPIAVKTLANTVAGRVVGDPEILIHGVANLQSAQAGDLTYLTHSKHLRDARATRASAIVVGEEYAGLRCAQIVTGNPAYAFARLVKAHFLESRRETGVHGWVFRGGDVHIGDDVSIGPFVTLASHVKIGRRVTIYPGVYIGECSEIGDDCIVYPNVTIRERTRIGHRVTVHSGTVIGSDGFGYVQHQGAHEKIPQLGNVIIEDDVEIGANVAVDRATFGSTVIKRGTKIDNLVQIAHNVSIGEDSIVIAQTGIAGSSSLGHHVVLAGQVGISDHVRIGDHVVVGAQSGVNRDVPSHQTVAGSPALPRLTWLRAIGTFSRLPDLYRSLQRLEKRLRALERGRSQ